MKRAIFAAIVLCVLEGVAASAEGAARLRLADAAVDACLASCASTNASCKRVCPATFSTPCLSSCDSQAQTCRQSCQSK
jgi:hypothetical protein